MRVDVRTEGQMEAALRNSTGKECQVGVQAKMRRKAENRRVGVFKC